MDRITLTPGKLYARLSAEYRKQRPASCSSCQMPMVFLVEPADVDTPNWRIEAPRCCEPCASLIRDIVERFGEKFDLFDPVSTAFRRPEAGAGHRTRAF